jgi:hypothetical protein
MVFGQFTARLSCRQNGRHGSHDRRCYHARRAWRFQGRAGPSPATMKTPRQDGQLRGVPIRFRETANGRPHLGQARVMDTDYLASSDPALAECQSTDNRAAGPVFALKPMQC